MRYLLAICFLVMLHCTSCSTFNNENVANIEYTYNLKECVDIKSTNWCIQKEIILETSLDAVVAHDANLLIDDNDLFLFNKSSVYRFDKSGKFLNTIGRLGRGNGEYVEISDVTINKGKRIIEILSPNYIHKFDYKGNFKEKMPISLSATSFIWDNSCYWASTGNITDKKIYKLNECGEEIASYVENLCTIPLFEDNFGKGTIKTFRNSFSHDIYHMENDSITLAYHMVFPGLDLPKSINSNDMVKLSADLEQNNYMMIRRFIENDQFIYMLLNENKNPNEPTMYHWIIDKKNNRDMCIKLTIDDLMKNPYHLNAQVLTNDNNLYCVGYANVENEDMLDKNPSVIIINLNNCWR